MSPLLEVAAITHPGKARPQNEDCVAVDPGAGLAVLADGMGGHNAGEVASRMAVELVTARLAEHVARETLHDKAQAEALVAASMAIANSRLLEAADTQAEYRGMGTTLVVALWHARGVTCAHVGDSRLYRLRHGELLRLTRDHSIVQEQVDRGAITPEQARYAPNRNVLTRAVGIDREVEADVQTTAFEPGDVYLLCSDGLTDMLTDEEIRDTLAVARDVDAAAGRLVALANDRGGLDNISAIVVRVAGGEERGA
jgi:PPM family protein phosphatase